MEAVHSLPVTRIEPANAALDAIDNATLPISKLQDMLESIRALCRANEAATNLSVEDFGTLVERLAERGIALCDEAFANILAIDGKVLEADAGHG